VSAAVLVRSLADQRRSLTGWGIGLVVVVAVMSALWPSVRDMMTPELLASYPEAMRELFDVEAMDTGAGYLNGELFSIILPGLFIAFAVGRGARTLAGEERDGTLEMVVVTPVSRSAVVVAKTVAIVLGTVVLGIVLAVSILVCSALFDLGIAPGDALVGSLAMTVLGVAFGVGAVTVGAVVPSRPAAVAIPAAVAVAAYVLHVLGALVPTVEPWRRLSPFTMAIVNGPVGGSVPAGVGVLAIAAVVLGGVAVLSFTRRDITSP